MRHVIARVRDEPNQLALGEAGGREKAVEPFRPIRGEARNQLKMSAGFCGRFRVSRAFPTERSPPGIAGPVENRARRRGAIDAGAHVEAARPKTNPLRNGGQRTAGRDARGCWD